MNWVNRKSSIYQSWAGNSTKQLLVSMILWGQMSWGVQTSGARGKIYTCPLLCSSHYSENTYLGPEQIYISPWANGVLRTPCSCFPVTHGSFSSPCCCCQSYTSEGVVQRLLPPVSLTRSCICCIYPTEHQSRLCLIRKATTATRKGRQKFSLE